MSQTILIAEDEATQRFTLQHLLDEAGFRVIQTKNAQEALSYLAREDAHALIDLLLTDLNMPGEMNGLALIQQAKQLLPNLPIIVLTLSQDLEDAVACVKAGAHDFISKPLEPNRLKLSIENTLQSFTMREEIQRITRTQKGEGSFEQLIGHDSGLKNAVAVGRKLAASDLPVLITGESGVGKEAFARALHGESSRAGHPFVAINCGAIPQNLAESTLFGHEKGAFTGAIQKALGKFREATGGTLFLDEIGELPADTQAKLLRALQNKEIEPVGLANSVKIDVRIISATHRDLHDDVTKGQFREDLFYRLNVLPVHLAPLRERPEDITLLVDYFIERLCAKEGILYRRFNAEAMRRLESHQWPGNVRELENCISRALLLAANEVITLQDLEPLLHRTRSGGTAVDTSQDAVQLAHPTGARKRFHEIEAEVIAKTLDHFNEHVPQAASALGIGQSTLYRKLKQV